MTNKHKDIKIKQGIIPELMGRPARVSSTLVVTQGNNTHHQNVGQVLPDDKIDCHTERSLLSISTALTNQGRDPEQKRLRMTTLLNNNPSRDEGHKACSLPPWREKVGVARMRGKNVFTARSVIPVLRTAENAGYSGRSGFTHGFTLIELLVVILIIAILAAIALPQYQKAVEKSRVAEAKLTLKAMAAATQLYCLTNGEHPSTLRDLEITIPTETKDWEYYIEECTGDNCACLFAAVSKHKNYSIELAQGEEYQEGNVSFFCVPWSNDGIGDCATFGTTLYTMPNTGWDIVKIQ